MNCPQPVLPGGRGTEQETTMLAHWNLARHPFVDDPETPYFHPAAAHVQALNRLQYLAESGTMRFGFLSGDNGTGKSAALRQACAHAARNPRIIPVPFDHPLMGVRDFLELLTGHFDRHASRARFTAKTSTLPTGGEMTVFEELLHRQVLRMDRRLFVCIDAAHLLDRRLAAVCALIAGMRGSADSGVSFLFAGTAQTARRLTQLPELGARLALLCELPAFTSEETAGYIDARMAAAGYRGLSPFDAAAKTAVHELAAGIPADINRVATLALEQAAAFREAFVSGDTVHAATELMLGRQAGA